MIDRLKARFHRLHPATQVVLSFLGVMVAGGLLLKLPFALQTGKTVTWMNAFFLSTSATCVTGLSPIDIGTTFSLFGKWVLILLMQVGGTGVMVLSSYLFLSIGKSTSLRQRMMIQETFAGDSSVEWKTLVKSVIHFVVLIEGVGVLIMTPIFMDRLPFFSALFYAIFHSVSAFCNSGLALYPDSFCSFRSHPVMNITITALIIFGGIGFFVKWEVLHWWRHRHKRYKMSLHSKTVLATTLLLIIGGTLAIWLLEWRNPALGATFLDRFWPSFFQSITPRTAGFNTIDITQLGNDTILLLIFFMFIGASPGSCGGGVKTTTFAVLIMLFWSRIRGGDKTNLFRRTLSEETVSRSLGLITLSLAVLVAANVLLLMTDFSGGHYDRNQMMDYLFESVSAFGTVGLSLNFTPLLSETGKLIIMGLMFFGRVGAMTILLQAVEARRNPSIEYAEEGLMLG